MPSKSKAEQAVMAIAEHTPGKLYARNRGVLKMSQQQLHDFAATKTKTLPRHVKKAVPRGTGNRYDVLRSEGKR